MIVQAHSWDQIKLAQLKELLARDVRNRPLTDCHRIGQLLIELKPDYGKEGARWIKTLNVVLDSPFRNWSTFSRFMKFARTYPKYSTSLFKNLTWVTMDYLLRVKNQSVRNKLLKQVRGNDWSIRDLKEEIHRLVGIAPRRRADSVPQMKLATEPTAIIRSLRQTLARLEGLCAKLPDTEARLVQKFCGSRNAEQVKADCWKLKKKLRDLKEPVLAAQNELEAIENFLLPKPAVD